MIDGAPGLEAALVAPWGEELPNQRSTADRHRNLLAHAPMRLQDGLTEDYRNMIHADTAAGIFKANLRLKATKKDWLRATAADSGKSLAFSLTVPHAPRIGPWGN